MAIHCEICGVGYRNHVSLVLHYQEVHPGQEELKCPGCDECQSFVGDLIAHLDEGRCPKIYQSEWLAFCKEKQAEVAAKDKPNFDGFISTTAAGSTGVWEDYAFRLDPAHFATAAPPVDGFKKEDFPALPGKSKGGTKDPVPALKLTLPIRTAKPAQPAAETPKDPGSNGRKKGNKKDSKKADETSSKDKESQQADKKPANKNQGTKKTLKTPVKTPKSLVKTPKSLVTVKDAKETKDEASPAPKPNAWAQKKNLFPEAAPAQRPTAEQLKIATAPNAKQTYLFSIHDPDHPHYDVEKYLTANGRYQCPMDNCIYTFETGEGLTFHLGYLGAHGGKKAECPSCGKRFKTPSALAHHAQMVGDRCRIKDSSHYGQFVSEISSGLVKADSVNEDNVTKYEVTEEASARFGKAQKPKKPVQEENDDFYADMLEPGPGEDGPVVAGPVVAGPVEDVNNEAQYW